MCRLASSLCDVGRKKKGHRWFLKARDVGAAHGFFSAECRASLGLRELDMDKRRDEKGLDLL